MLGINQNPWHAETNVANRSALQYKNTAATPQNRAKPNINRPFLAFSPPENGCNLMQLVATLRRLLSTFVDFLQLFPPRLYTPGGYNDPRRFL
jgi:hypothetical protein